MDLDNNRSYLLHSSHHGSIIFIESKKDFLESCEWLFSYRPATLNYFHLLHSSELWFLTIKYYITAFSGLLILFLFLPKIDTHFVFFT